MPKLPLVVKSYFLNNVIISIIIIMSNQTTDNGVTKVIPFVFSFTHLYLYF